MCAWNQRYPACYAHVVYRAVQYFSTLSHKRHDFRDVCFDILYIVCPKYFSFQELSKVWSKMYIGLNVKYPLFLSDFDVTGICWTDFRKFLDTSSLENPFSGSRVVPCGQTDRYDEANCRFSQFCERTWNRHQLGRQRENARNMKDFSTTYHACVEGFSYNDHKPGVGYLLPKRHGIWYSCGIPIQNLLFYVWGLFLNLEHEGSPVSAVGLFIQQT